jgi:Ca2+-binding RTX toxin-like protein
MTLTPGPVQADHLQCGGLTTTIDGTAGNDNLAGTAGDDVIAGGDGDDTIDGGGGNDTICGGNGHDNLTGGDGNDTLLGGDGNDELYAGDGNDNLEGGTGDDLFDGGPGIDQATWTNAATGVHADLGAGTATGVGLDTLIAIENLQGSQQEDTLIGDAGNNQIHGFGGNDTIDGGDGHDSLNGGPGDDGIIGGDGIDTVTHFLGGAASFVNAPGPVNVDLVAGTATGFGNDTLAGIENVNGSSFDDVIVGDANNNSLSGLTGDDQLDGGSGVDSLNGGSGSDTCLNAESNFECEFGVPPPPVFCVGLAATIVGTSGNDNIVGTAGSDVIAGLDGDDAIDGLGGNDTICGGAGADEVHGGPGDDLLDGGDGNDQLFGEDGGDGLRGGAGDDLLDGGPGGDRTQSFNAAVTVNLGAGTATGEGADALVSIELVIGSQFNDTLIGSDGNDTLWGWGGDDTIQGGLGNDTLNGGAGNDILDGGGGSDRAVYFVQAGLPFNAPGPVLADLSTGGASGDGNDTFIDIENLTGSAFADTLTGDDGPNSILGGDGNDTIFGLGGDDFLFGGNGTDTLDGGDGNDGCGTDGETFISCESTVTPPPPGGSGAPSCFGRAPTIAGTNGNDVLIGTSANDVIAGLGGDDVIEGGDGNDLICGGDGNDTIDGGAGVDFILPGAGDDQVDGGMDGAVLNYGAAPGPVTVNLSAGTAVGEGTDTITNVRIVVGSGFDDHLIGDENNNSFLPGSGNDIVEGLGGNDTFTTSNGDDIFDGGDGVDRVQYFSQGTLPQGGAFTFDAPGPVTLNLQTGMATGHGTDTLISIEVAVGSSHDDYLIGNDAANSLYGAGGDDVIDGGGGDDLLDGQDGADSADGGAGTDICLAESLTTCESVEAESSTAPVGGSTSVSVAPQQSGSAGVSATLTNMSSGFTTETVTVATYLSNPGTPDVFDVGGGYVDVAAGGVDGGDSVTAKFYYPNTITGSAEADLKLYFYTGSAWIEVLSSGGAVPAKDTMDNLDDTVSGGRFTVVFDDTSTPKLTELTGTVFSSSTTRVPAAGPSTGPVAPVAVGTSIEVETPFTDADPGDTHTATFAWGDGTSSAGVVSGSGSARSASGAHSYTTPGVYTVRVTIDDGNGGVAESLFEFVVVYDPSGGFVTGGGWIDSLAGAYLPDATLAGKATFGFVAKYNPGANEPAGHTEFQFKAGDFAFTSTSYDWLVVAGTRAQFKGSGTINGQGDYAFLLTGIDGQVAGGGGADRFRIKIWDKETGEVIYDNKRGVDDGSLDLTALGGGSIVVHKE